jgi:hypothetical protein
METGHLFTQSFSQPSLSQKMWRVSWLLAFGIFDLFLVYVFFLDGSLSILSSWSKAVAGTSAVLLGMSLSLSSFGYYFDFLDKHILYRKYLGLTGFWLALLYSVILLFVNPARYFYGFFDNLGTADFVLGLSAMAIFTLMALVSNNRAMQWIGPALWRQILGLGYVAYALLVIRALFIEGDQWIKWWEVGSGLPPARLVISVLAVAVLLFRLSVPFAKAWRAKQAPVPSALVP